MNLKPCYISMFLNPEQHAAYISKHAVERVEEWAQTRDKISAFVIPEGEPNCDQPKELPVEESKGREVITVNSGQINPATGKIRKPEKKEKRKYTRRQPAAVAPAPEKTHEKPELAVDQAMLEEISKRYQETLELLAKVMETNEYLKKEVEAFKSCTDKNFSDIWKAKRDVSHELNVLQTETVTDIFMKLDKHDEQLQKIFVVAPEKKEPARPFVFAFKHIVNHYADKQ